MDSLLERTSVEEELFPESTTRLRSLTSSEPVYQPTEHDVRQHMHLVYRVVSQLQRKLPSNVERDELVAAGTMGLLDAIRKNHRALGSPVFECYARIRIRGAILDDLRHLDWSPRRKKGAATDGVTVPVTIVALDDVNAGAADIESSSPHALTEAMQLRRAVDIALAQLPERDRRVLELRYVHDVPAKEIAVMLGVSEARVSQLHTRATTTLRGLLAPYGHAQAEIAEPMRQAA